MRIEDVREYKTAWLCILSLFVGFVLGMLFLKNFATYSMVAAECRGQGGHYYCGRCVQFLDKEK